MTATVKVRTGNVKGKRGITSVQLNAAGPMPEGALFGATWSNTASTTMKIRGLYSEAAVNPPRPVWTLCERPDPRAKDEPIATGKTWIVPSEGRVNARLTTDTDGACRVRIGLVAGLEGPLTLRVREVGSRGDRALRITVPDGADQTSSATWKWWQVPNGWIVLEVPGCATTTGKGEGPAAAPVDPT